MTSASVFNLVCQTNSAKYGRLRPDHGKCFWVFFRPCFLIVGDAVLFEEHRSSFLFLAKQLFQQYGTRMAYLDTSSTKQIGFSKILSSIYRPDEKKLFVSCSFNGFEESHTSLVLNRSLSFADGSTIPLSSSIPKSSSMAALCMSSNLLISMSSRISRRI